MNLESKFYHINDDLLVKYLLDETTAEEKTAVEEWLNEATSNRHYYAQLKQVWDSSRQLAAVSSADENKAWERFQQRVAKNTPARQAQVVKRFTLLKTAAAIILAAGLAVTLYFITATKNNGELTASTALYTLVDTLPDGSVVTLNRKSSVTYPKKFKGKRRSVTMHGEAFFNITPDKEKPFVISVNDVEITVVGTSFNVKSDGAATEVVVETGVVRVRRGGKTVELKAGEKLLLAAEQNSAVKDTVSDKLYNYYRSREFVCDNTPLWKLVETLNQAYDTRIIIGRKELNDLRITTTFNNESLDKVLEIIHLTLDVTVTRKDGQVILQ